MTLIEFENLTSGQIIVFKYRNIKFFGKIIQIYKTKHHPIIIEDIKNPGWQNCLTIFKDTIFKDIKSSIHTYENLYFLTQEEKLELL